jgi:hypothetical protein
MEYVVYAGYRGNEKVRLIILNQQWCTDSATVLTFLSPDCTRKAA